MTRQAPDHHAVDDAARTCSVWQAPAHYEMIMNDHQN
jgi:hypothetical protein